MKKSFFALILFLVTLNAYSQGSYRKKTFYKNSTVLFEEYDVHDSLSTIKDGYYARYYRSGKIKKTGSYINNFPTGVWYFYDDSSQLVSKYNYTSGLTIFSIPDTLSKNYLKLAGVDTNFYSTYEKIPEFVGGYVELNDFLAQNLRYPMVARQNNIKGNVIVSFYVNSIGYIESPKVLKGLGYGCDDEVLRVIKLMPKWTPARRQGTDVKCLYYMAFNFSF